MKTLTKFALVFILSFSICLPAYSSRPRPSIYQKVQWSMNSNTANFCWLDYNATQRLSRQMKLNDKDSGEMIIDRNDFHIFQIRCHTSVDQPCGERKAVVPYDKIERSKTIYIKALAVSKGNNTQCEIKMHVE